MANDVNANIRVNLDTSQALAGLQSLQSRISSFNQSVIQSNAQAVAAQRNLLNNFQAQVGASRQFSTSITNVETSVGRLQTAIDKNRLSMGQYFRYGVASSKNFGKVFRQENEAITRLATERVQKLQTQYVALGQAQGGMTKALAVRPLQMFNADSAIAIQKSQIFNKLLQDGSTSLVNWGKNTQWAGRQLMVGFTVPLTIFGGMAAKTFMELEEQAISFRKVYGDIFTTEAEVEENLAAIRELNKEMTKYGIAASETFELANVAAQAGARGEDLIAQTREATRLAVLGQMEQQEAIKTTITLQNAFQLSNEDLADSINFLNIVENQSVLSLQDVSGAIPRVAPVIKSLGGDVRDLSVMLVAMREGGVSAAEGANALKTSLARLISPTAGASKMAKEMGINLNSIVEANQGDILGAVMQLAGAMEELDELSQQRLLSEIFGKRQYARVGALFNNITNEASQAQRVLDLTTMSTADLAATAEKELGAVEQSISTKFTAAVELLKTEIAPIGEQFLKLATPIVDAVGKIFAKFNDLSPTVKNFVTILAAGVGVVVPVVLMLVGLFGNLLGNLVKGFATLGQFFQRIRNGSESVEYLAGNQLEAAAAAASLEGQVTGLTGSLNIQREAIDSLTQAYGRYIAGANTAAASLPQGFRTPSAPAVAPAGMASGGMVGGVGNKDTEPALLTPGEFVINADASKRFAPLLAAINEGRVGKYARGRTEGNISFGGLGSVNIPAAYGQVSIDRIQAMADDLAGAGDDVRLAFKQILEDLSQTQGLTKGMVQQAEALKSSQFPEISKMAGESKYSASKAGEKRSIEAQLREDLADRANNEQLIAQEYARAQAAIDGSIISLNEYYDGLVRNANSEEEIEAINDKRLKHIQEASRMDRAHIVELTNAQKLERESWNARLWMPQSGIENQLSNMLARSENNQAIYEQYLMDLADTSVSEDQRLQILEKVRGNIALTDSELDIQARVLQNIVEDAERNAILVRKANGEFAKMSAEFIPYAQGAIGAAGGRAAMGPVDPAVQAERIAMSQGVIGGFRDDIRANSPSEAAADVADSVPEGVAKGIKRSTPQATAAARELAQEVEGQLMMEFEDDDALFPAAPYKGERRLQPAITPTQRQQREPLPVAPKSVQDDLIRATQRASTGLNNAGNQASQTAKRFAGLRGGIAKFGGALRGGSMKMQGAFFALDGLVFAASMMNNSLGEVAQKALPVVFGLQGLTMVLPLLEGMLFKMIAVLGGVGTGLVALVAAAAIGMKLWSDRVNAARQKTADYVVALDGSIQSLRAFSEKFGTALPTERIRQRLQGITDEEEQERVTEAQTFLREGGGQAIIERVSGLSMEERFNALRMELLQGIAFEIMTPEQARDIAKAIGLELSSPALGNRLVMSIRDAISQDSGSLENAFVGIIEESVERSKSFAEDFAKTIEENRVAISSADVALGPDVALTDEQAQQQADIDLSNIMGPGYEEALESVGIKTEEATEKTEELTTVIIKMDDVLKFVGPAINNLGRLAQAQDTLNLKFREGLIDLEEFRRLSGQIEEGRESLAGAFENLLQAEGGVQQFNDAFDKTLTALGRTKEEIDAINNQAAAAADSVAALVEGADADVIEMGLKVGLADESITPEEVAAFYAGLAEDPDLAIKAQVILEDAAPEDIPRLMQIINEMSNLPEEVQTRIMTEFETDPPDFTKINEILLASTRFSEFPNLQEKAINIAINGGQQAQENLSRMEEYLTSISSNSEISATFDFEAVDLVDLKKASDNWDSLGKKKNISKIIKANDQYSSVLDDFKVSYKELDSMPDIVKQAILLKLEILADVEVKLANVDPNDIPSMAGYTAQRDALKAQLEGLFDIGLDTGGDTGETEDTGGTTGGGEREKTFLEQLDADLKTNSKLYLNAKNGLEGYAKNRGNFFGVFQKVRRKGIPEAIVEELGTGPEAIKRARELLALGKEELDQLIKDFQTVSVGEVVENARRKAIEDEEKARAARKTKNLDPELQDIILADKELTRAFANTKKGTPEYERLLKVVRRLANAKEDLADATATETDKQKEAIDAIDEARQSLLNDFERREALFQQEFGRIEREWQPIIAANEEQVELLQEQVNAVQEEIDAIQRLNEADERRIRGLERQKEMLDRQIESIERQNEMDQRRIEQLNREDEMRNRVADALQKELELLSNQEEKIRETYEKRVNALDEVAQANDYIINQQKQQLGLSQAIAEGDIYAATQAAQEMRAASAQQAAEQTRAGLEQGMESQIAGLRTSGGLTREQAEERINQIQEQSYQTSLKIREIEDLIYQRNLDIVPLKDQQYNLNQQIQGIQDIIYGRESQILDIQVSRLQPLEDQLSAQQQSLSNNQKALADAKAAVRIEGQTYDELQNQISAEKEAYDVAVALIKAGGDQRRSVENIRKKWVEVTNQIAAAVRTAKQLSETALMGATERITEVDLAAVEGRITPDTAEQRKADARAARDAALAGIFEARDAEISAALASGTESLRMAKGGKIMGYRGGGVVSGMQALAYGGPVYGNGGRDSVPAMLMPGEFVVRKAMVEKYGEGLMRDINMGSFAMPSYEMETEMGTPVVQSNNMVSNINAPVYNSYDMKFSINGANQSADEIANTVMFKMRQLQNQGIRTNRGY